MTTLIVEPLDMEAKGSYRKRKLIFQAMAEMRNGNDPIQQAALLLQVEEMAVGQMHTDDGTPVEEALDELSARQFDALLEGLLGEPVPRPSAGS